MKDKYTPGQDCMCSAYSESECGCNVDWTPAEVYELRDLLAAERALADQLAEIVEVGIEDLDDGDWPQAFAALAAWKEVRSER